MVSHSDENHDSSRWTGEPMPGDLGLAAMILAAGAIGLLIIALVEI